MIIAPSGAGGRNSSETLRPPARGSVLAAALLVAALLPIAPVRAAAAGRASSDPPVLTGRLERRQVLGISPAWKEGYRDYEPDPAAVARIRAAEGKVHGDLSVEVVMGSWCSDSRREVPRFIKLERILGGARLPAVFIAVDRGKEIPAGASRASDLRVEKVPTFVVYVGKTEAGRIVEEPEVSVESDLAGILERAAGG